MDNLVTGLLGAAWLAIAAVLLWRVVDGVRKSMRDDSPLPLFLMLERHGLTVAQVEAIAGIEVLARALRRCAHCRARPDCGPRRVECLNEALLRDLAPP